MYQFKVSGQSYNGLFTIIETFLKQKKNDLKKHVTLNPVWDV